MLSPGSSQDSPSWLWGTVCTGTPQHVESEGWKDAPVTLKDIPSTSNPHPNLETSVSPHCTPGVVPGTAAGCTRIGTAGYPQRPPQPGHCARAPQAWGSTFLPCQPLHPLLPAALPAEQAARCATLSLSLTLRLLSSVQPGFLQAGCLRSRALSYTPTSCSLVRNLCHYQHFFPELCFSHFKYKPRALVCMQLKSGLAFFLMLSLLSTLIFLVFMSHSGPPTILTTFKIGTASSHRTLFFYLAIVDRAI